MTEKVIWEFFIQRGFTPEGTAGLMGNLKAESGLKSNKLEGLCIQRLYEDTGKKWTSEEWTEYIDKITTPKSQFLAPRLPKKKADGSDYLYGYGLAQWTTKGRKSALYDMCKERHVSIGDMNTQLDYLVEELQKAYKSLYDYLKQTKSVREASTKILKEFEAPANTGTSVQELRYKYADEFYTKYELKNNEDSQTVINVAISEEGYLEKASNKDLDSKTGNAGSGNYTKYWRDLKPSYQGQYWCNAFVNWCFVRSYGESLAKELLCSPKEWSYYTPETARYFYDQGRFFSTPQPKDIIYFRSDKYEKQGRWKGIHHVGIVYKVDGSKVYTIEGNTTQENKVVPNGGAVCLKSYTYPSSSIAGFGRPKFSQESNLDVIDIVCGRTGFKIVGTDVLNVRDYPVTGAVIGQYKRNQYVQSFSMTYVNGNPWYKTDIGWISGQYVEGWREVEDVWEYILVKNTRYTNKVVTIDGYDYIFDKNGVMITKDRINDSGAITYEY